MDCMLSMFHMEIITFIDIKRGLFSSIFHNPPREGQSVIRNVDQKRDVIRLAFCDAVHCKPSLTK